MKRKFISALLIAAMSVSVASINVFADEQRDPAVVTEDDGIVDENDGILTEGSEYANGSSAVN